MNRRTVLTVLLLICVMASSACAADTLFIRLVRASNTDEGIDPQLRDVVQMLRRTLVFKSYSLIGAARHRLPTKGMESRLAEFSVRCSGTQRNLRITVRRGRSVLLNTTVDLKDNIPLVLGGFPGKGGHQVLIFLAEKSRPPKPARRPGRRYK